ncbi:sister chromatid cohesion 1 protein 3-like isoform X1 [Macadamia integrifolia]|uniref:sister chromatid cohesion 1 protein 3-like isoform X1 n=1 Tax=Macadamia integrifolia TaxID=60698 RepID=UPI001C4F818C|nr:sister chromatid cohesion 1 protein 3-like isoform X1 [Macadamia integrifolia]
MFYSHSFLAKKSPLGTIWMAAHMQQIRKPQIVATDIPSSVDCIMFPEVPIALRLSAHLLLGVVVIYSKKVEYLWRDSNTIWRTINTVFGTGDVNLPEDATHAPFYAVTLPETFELDAWNLDAEFSLDGSPDNHLKSREEITLIDQIPAEGNPYIAFFIDEDIRMDISPPAEIPEISPMEEDVPYSVPADNVVGVSDPGPRDQTAASSQRDAEVPTSQGLPEIEVIRDAVHNFGSEDFPELPDLSDGAFEQNSQFNQNMSGERELSPIVEDILVSGGQSEPFQLQPEPPASVASEEALEGFNTHFSLGHMSPGLVIQPTPPVEKQKPRPRKRKQSFDQSVVLPNKFMKESLKDPSRLVHRRKKLPCTNLDVWRFNNRLRTEHVFHEQSISGLCTDLQNIYKKDFISSRVGLIPTEDAPAELRGAQSPAPIPDHEMETQNIYKKDFISSRAGLIPTEDAPAELRGAQSPAPIPDHEMEIEHLRFEEGHVGSISISELMPTSPGLVPSPSIRDGFTPIHASSLGPGHMSEMSAGTEVLPTPDREGFTEPPSTELGTPMTRFEEHFSLRDTGFSVIPELLNSAEADDLNFLEAYDTPASKLTGNRQNEEVDTLSVRTRAVAQYLRRQSPLTPNSKGPSGILSLNKILEGKTRKLSARMFYETLVLKSYGLIDVEQEVPYGDITLKSTVKLSKAQL